MTPDRWLDEDDLPRDTHTLGCPIWESSRPEDDCTCQPGGLAAATPDAAEMEFDDVRREAS